MGEHSIDIAVKESDQLVQLVLSNAVNRIVEEESVQLSARNESASVSVDSLEAGVWSEISDVAKSLSVRFVESLTITSGNKKVLKSLF